VKIFLSGPVEGFLSPFFDAVEASQASWAVCAGDFGIWPDPARMDRASRQHGGLEFSKYYVGAINREIRVPVLTIAGVHDDHQWLAQRKAANNTEILSNVHWLANGYKTQIGMHGLPCRVTGFGRVYSETTYRGQPGKRSWRHYTRQDMEKACSSGPTDLLVIYESLDAPDIVNIIFATRPKLILTMNHPNRKIHISVQGIPVITLGRTENRVIVWNEGSFLV